MNIPESTQLVSYFLGIPACAIRLKETWTKMIDTRWLLSGVLYRTPPFTLPPEYAHAHIAPSQRQHEWCNWAHRHASRGPENAQPYQYGYVLEHRAFKDWCVLRFIPMMLRYLYQGSRDGPGRLCDWRVHSSCGHGLWGDLHTREHNTQKLK